MNMNYELAKELKNAGFPFRVGTTYYHQVGDRYGNNEPYIVTTHDDPTLEELIDACGNEFVLERDKNRIEDSIWCAGDWIDRERVINRQFFGSTPTEAVAMLYLALHGKTRSSVEGE